MGKIYIYNNKVKKIIAYGKKVKKLKIYGDTLTIEDNYLTFTAIEDSTFKFTNSIQYSLDNGSTWTTLPPNTNTPTVTAGSKILFKAELSPVSGSGVGTFSSTGRFNVEGNPLSLLYGDNFEGVTDLSSKSYAFQKLFKECTNVVDASGMELPATTLSIRCYSEMFSNCSSLTSAPDLPATVLAEYSYQSMFWGCSSLTTAPVIAATTLVKGCFRDMFHDCTSLTTAPELPATKLVEESYYQMLRGCSRINYIKCLATDISATNCLNNWTNGLPSTGTFVKAASMEDWPTSNNGIPIGWTVQNAKK